MQYRRFGKTEFEIPVISCGGMRYQQSWKDTDAITEESQRNLEACIRKAIELGITHIETARGYGTSEEQLGHILPQFKRDSILVQSKVSPDMDVEKFRANFEKSMRLLRLDYLDIFSFHGINSEGEFEAMLQCLDQAQQWKREGRIRDIGFSTHAAPALILKTIETGVMEHINLHWYYFYQDTWKCIEAARARDMGVFIISPNDKGGLLYKPSQKLVELCAPLHPMVFNGLFCLMHEEVHTLSCGVARPEDFDIHMETVALLDRAGELVPPIVARLEQELQNKLGQEWVRTWQLGLPDWEETPDHINVPVILRLRNLALAYDMIEYGKMRYNLLGNGGTWFPGQTAEKLPEHDLTAVLANSPHREKIPAALKETHALLSGEKKKRLQQE